jgi:reactive chlorine resistance protein C
MLNVSNQSVEFFGKLKRFLPIRERSIVAGRKIQAIGDFVLRYGLVLILVWIGGMKFTAFEAAGIQPLVDSSPLLSWMYAVLSVQAVSNLFGIVEIGVAGMIALRPWAPKVSALGSALAVIMFLTTLSFLFSLPGWEPSLGGFPALSSAGAFLLKDAVLLGTGLWSLGESLVAVRLKENDPPFSNERLKSACGG